MNQDQERMKAQIEGIIDHGTKTLSETLTDIDREYRVRKAFLSPQNAGNADPIVDWDIEPYPDNKHSSGIAQPFRVGGGGFVGMNSPGGSESNHKGGIPMKRVCALIGMVVISIFFVSPLISCSTLKNSDARQIYLQHWGKSGTVQQ